MTGLSLQEILTTDKGSVHDELLAREREVALSDPEYFIRYVIGYDPKPFHIEWFRAQLEHNRTLILGPRKHAKTTYLSVIYSLYRIAQDPNVRIIIASGALTTATEILSQIKAIIERNEHYRRLFGVEPDFRAWATGRVTVKRSLRLPLKDPTIRATSVGSRFIGARADYIICDDLLNDQNSQTEYMQEKIWRWLVSTILPMLEDKSGWRGSLHFIGTPWRVNDVYYMLMEHAKQDTLNDWFVKTYDAILDEEKKIVLWPEKMDWNALMADKALMVQRGQGEVFFDQQYRCKYRIGVGGTYVKESWIRYADGIPSLDFIVIGTDWAVSDVETSDYFAYVVLGGGRTSSGAYGLYVLESGHAHMTPEAQMSHVETLARKYGDLVKEIGCEAVAFSELMQRQLEKRTGLPYTKYMVTRTKEQRLLGVMAYLESGRVYFRRSGDADLIRELLEFPNGQHDDLVDAFTMAVALSKKYMLLERGQQYVEV
ncbi:MAG: hypothetical protein QXW98_06555 [Candidatus Caldarchaeum sp.]